MWGPLCLLLIMWRRACTMGIGVGKTAPSESDDTLLSSTEFTNAWTFHPVIQISTCNTQNPPRGSTPNSMSLRGQSSMIPANCEPTRMQSISAFTPLVHCPMLRLGHRFILQCYLDARQTYPNGHYTQLCKPTDVSDTACNTQHIISTQP